MDTKPYIPERGNLSDWGDDYANRSDRMLAGVGYLDGIHASAIFCRGYYTRTVIAAWDWDGKELKNHWTFDTNTPEWASYAGQGNHNLRVADVDPNSKELQVWDCHENRRDGSDFRNAHTGEIIFQIPSKSDVGLPTLVWRCGALIVMASETSKVRFSTVRRTLTTHNINNT